MNLYCSLVLLPHCVAKSTMSHTSCASSGSIPHYLKIFSRNRAANGQLRRMWLAHSNSPIHDPHRVESRLRPLWRFHNTTLMSVKHPPNDKVLAFHLDCLAWNFWIIWFHFFQVQVCTNRSPKVDDWKRVSFTSQKTNPLSDFGRGRSNTINFGFVEVELKTWCNVKSLEYTCKIFEIGTTPFSYK